MQSSQDLESMQITNDNLEENHYFAQIKIFIDKLKSSQESEQVKLEDNKILCSTDFVRLNIENNGQESILHLENLLYDPYKYNITFSNVENNFQIFKNHGYAQSDSPVRSKNERIELLRLILDQLKIINAGQHTEISPFLLPTNPLQLSQNHRTSPLHLEPDLDNDQILPEEVYPVPNPSFNQLTPPLGSLINDDEYLNKIRNFTKVLKGKFFPNGSNISSYEKCDFKDHDDFYEFNSDQYKITFNKTGEFSINIIDKIKNNNSVNFNDRIETGVAIFSTLAQLGFPPNDVVNFAVSILPSFAVNPLCASRISSNKALRSNLRT